MKTGKLPKMRITHLHYSILLVVEEAEYRGWQDNETIKRCLVKGDFFILYGEEFLTLYQKSSAGTEVLYEFTYDNMNEIVEFIAKT